MDFKKEILGAIQVITQQTVQKLCPNITFGIVKAVGNKNKCTVTVDGVEQNLTYYGNTSPTINQKYPVFVPFGNMSLGFIMTFGGNGQSGFQFPIGYVYISAQATSPADLLGYGTWVRIKDKFLLSAGDTYSAGSTGGEATHALTVDEIPSHQHTILNGNPSGYGYDFSQWAAKIDGQIGFPTNINTDFVGGGQPHNNMPPYLVVYVWQRTA